LINETTNHTDQHPAITNHQPQFIQDLEGLLVVLEGLPALRELDLSGCPVTEAEGYRSTVILRLKDLEVGPRDATRQEACFLGWLMIVCLPWLLCFVKLLDGAPTGEEREALLKPATPLLRYEEGKK
jgi:hypothetical protein